MWGFRPDLACKEASEKPALSDEMPARARESGSMIGELANGHVREHAECKVQATDERRSDRAAVKVRRNCEFGDYPDGIWTAVAAKLGSERGDFA